MNDDEGAFLFLYYIMLDDSALNLRASRRRRWGAHNQNIKFIADRKTLPPSRLFADGQGKWRIRDGVYDRNVYTVKPLSHHRINQFD